MSRWFGDRLLYEDCVEDMNPLGWNNPVFLQPSLGDGWHTRSLVTILLYFVAVVDMVVSTKDGWWIRPRGYIQALSGDFHCFRWRSCGTAVQKAPPPHLVNAVLCAGFLFLLTAATRAKPAPTIAGAPRNLCSSWVLPPYFAPVSLSSSVAIFRPGHCHYGSNHRPKRGS